MSTRRKAAKKAKKERKIAREVLNKLVPPIIPKGINTYFTDIIGGVNSNSGTSFAIRKKTISSV